MPLPFSGPLLPDLAAVATAFGRRSAMLFLSIPDALRAVVW